MPRRSILLVVLLVSASSVRAAWNHDLTQPAEFFAGPGSHLYKHAIEDGAGGTFVAWREESSPRGGRLQRLDPQGREMWPGGGVWLTSFEMSPARIQLVPDGAGGVIAFWSDTRDDPESHIFAQRFDAQGTALWTADGVQVSHGRDPVLAVGNLGTILRSWDGGITWEQVTSPSSDLLRTVEIRAPDLTYAAGNTFFKYSIDYGDTWFDREDGVYTFNDIEFGASDFGVAAGYYGWVRIADQGPFGAPFAPGANPYNLFGVAASESTAVAVGEFGVVHYSLDRGATWNLGNGLGVELADVDFVWDQTLVAVGGDLLQSTSIIQRSVDNGATWTEMPSPAPYKLLGVDMDPSGRGVAVGLGGVAVYTADGGLTWSMGSTGTSESLEGVTLVRPTIAVAVGSNGTIIRSTNGGATWQAMDSGTTWGLWSVAAYGGELSQDWFVAVSDGGGGGTVAYAEERSFTAADVFAVRIDSNGNPVWPNPAAIVVRPTYPYNFNAVPGGSGGLVAAWTDDRNGQYDYELFGQIVYGYGSLAFGNGIQISDDPETETNIQLASDAADGAHIVWTDWDNWGVHWAHLESNGTISSPSGGADLTSVVNRTYDPVIASDSDGNFVVSWSEQVVYPNPQVFAQGYDPQGNALWPANVVVLGSDKPEYSPEIVSDGAGGVIITVEKNDVAQYAVAIDADGNFRWPQGVLFRIDVPVGSFPPHLVSDGTLGVFAFWEHWDGVDYHLYGQNVGRYGYLGLPHPGIVSVVDVPNDQGGFVTVSWDASYVDAFPEQTITHYSVWRRQPPDTGWAHVDDTQALYFTLYGMDAPTYADATPTTTPVTEFQVVAHTTDPFVFWTSGIGSGYSVDNIAPGVPKALQAQAAAGYVELQWENGDSHEEDVAFYRVYRGESPGFLVGASNLLATTNDTGYTDVLATGATYAYAVAAVDGSGNESEPSDEVVVDAAVAVADEREGFSTQLLLRAPYPNPTVGRSVFRFSLPARASVDLDVFNLAGRRVLAENLGTLSSGWHDHAFLGRDQSGRRLASGAYFLRLRAGDRRSVVKVMVAR